MQNISITVQKFDFSESSHLFNQGMMTGSWVINAVKNGKYKYI